MQIKIENFQSLGKVEIEAKGLTVLVGRSNLGKSAVVRAIEGALFNRPGEDFVREGKLAARVAVENLPTNDGTSVLGVQWTKGHNLNQFIVDGDEYSKVGQSAPPPVMDAGYRDVKIGSESIRPQVASQFDPLFLLTQPGSFVSDVLSVISRLAVLLTADRACAKDLKAQKQLLTVRTVDKAEAERKLVILQPITDLHGRVQALRALLDTAKAAQEQVKLLRALVVNRARLAPAAAQCLPAATTVDPELGAQWADGRQLAQVRREWTALTAHKLPTPSPKKLQLAVGKLDTTVTVLRALAETRRGLVRLAGLVLPADAKVAVQVDQAEDWRRKALDVRGLHDARRAAVTMLDDARRGLKSVKTDLEVAEGALGQVLAEVKVCPVCSRPWSPASE